MKPTDDFTDNDDDLLPEYDLSKLKGGVRGKYLQRYRAGTVDQVRQKDQRVQQELSNLIA